MKRAMRPDEEGNKKNKFDSTDTLISSKEEKEDALRQFAMLKATKSDYSDDEMQVAYSLLRDRGLLGLFEHQVPSVMPQFNCILNFLFKDSTKEFKGLSAGLMDIIVSTVLMAN